MAFLGRWLAVLGAAAVLFPAAAGAHPRHHHRTVHHHSRHRAHRADTEEAPIRVEPDGTEILGEWITTPQDEQEAAELAACCLIAGPEAGSRED